MGTMKEFYQKVAGDTGLQSKFFVIVNNTERLSTGEVEKKLLDFAKDAGYEISIGDMQEFFKSMAEQNHDELLESELDMVAGGKGGSIDWGKIGSGTLIAGSAVAGASGAGAVVSVGCVAGAIALEGSTR